jgi:hypothetical protein
MAGDPFDRQREDAFKRVVEHRNRLLKAVKGLLDEPYGCSLCDSGVPRLSTKGHQPDCPFLIARAVISQGLKEGAF